MESVWTDLACLVVEHTLRPFRDYVPTYKARRNKTHVYTVSERRQIALNLLDEITRDYQQRLNFISFGKIPRHVACFTDCDLEKFREQARSIITEQYKKSVGEINILIYSLDNQTTRLYSSDNFN